MSRQYTPPLAGYDLWVGAEHRSHVAAGPARRRGCSGCRNSGQDWGEAGCGEGGRPRPGEPPCGRRRSHTRAVAALTNLSPSPSDSALVAEVERRAPTSSSTRKSSREAGPLHLAGHPAGSRRPRVDESLDSPAGVNKLVTQNHNHTRRAKMTPTDGPG